MKNKSFDKNKKYTSLKLSKPTNLGEEFVSKAEVINQEYDFDEIEIFKGDESWENPNDDKKFDFSFFEMNNFSGSKWKDCDIITLDTLFVDSEKKSSNKNEDSKTSTSSANSVCDNEEDSRIIADEDDEVSKDFLNKKRNRNIYN